MSFYFLRYLVTPPPLFSPLINKLSEFFHLFSRYFDLQSVNTYYSLIGAVLNV